MMMYFVSENVAGDEFITDMHSDNEKDACENASLCWRSLTKYDQKRRLYFDLWFGDPEYTETWQLIKKFK